MRVYTLKDRINIQIGELVFKLAPLSYRQKIEIQSAMDKSPIESSILCVKYSLKDVKGLTFADGSEYKLRFEGEAILDECIDEILNVAGATKLQLACMSLLNGIPTKIVHPQTGEEIEGVRIIESPLEPKVLEQK